MTPKEIIAQASEIAERLQAMTRTLRRQELQRLKATNELLHSLVKARLEP